MNSLNIAAITTECIDHSIAMLFAYCGKAAAVDIIPEKAKLTNQRKSPFG